MSTTERLTARHFADPEPEGEKIEEETRPAYTPSDESDKGSEGKSSEPEANEPLPAPVVGAVPFVSIPNPAELKPLGKRPWRLFRWATKKWDVRKALYDDAVARMASAIYLRQQALIALVFKSPIVLTPVSPKGGAGKTASSTCLAAVLGDATHRSILVIDANPDWGGAAKRLGIVTDDDETKENTISLSMLVRLIKADTTPAEIERMMIPTENRVFVVRSDDANVRRLGVEKFRELVEHMKKLFSIIILDTGTGITSDINTACVEIADVITFPLLTVSGNATKGGPVDGCKYAREQLVADGFVDEVARSITIALGVEYGESLDPYRKATENLDGVMLPVPFDQRMAGDEVVRVIPFDRYVNNTERGIPQKSIDPYTQIAYLDVAIAAFQQAQSQTTPQPAASDAAHTTGKEEA